MIPHEQLDRWRRAQEAGLVVLPPDRELWFNSRRIGEHWRVEAVSGDGFNEIASGWASGWTANWKMRWAERRLRARYRDWSPSG